MPKPPGLPIPEWHDIFQQAKRFEEWLDGGDKPEHQDQMREYISTGALAPFAEGRIGALRTRVHVLIFAEDWCPDVVRHVPIVEKLSQINNDLHTRYFYLNDRPDLLVRYLTVGGEAVPKMVFFSHEWVECGVWGPMPAACRELIARGRACGDLKQARKQVSALYDSDPDRRIATREILDQIENAAAETP